jgi:putative flippase GtrA
MYLVAGGIATASHYVTTIVAVESFRVVPLAASIAGFVVGAFVKYGLNYFVAFRSAQRHVIAAPRFALMEAILLAGNALFFWLLHDLLGLHYMAAQVLTTLALIPPGYLLGRLWVFR